MEDQYTIADFILNRSQIALMLYPGFSETDVEILKKFRDSSAKPEKGFVVDVLGIRTRTSSLVKALEHLDGQLLGYPVPFDYHSETVEWIGLAKSVINADEKFVAMELGAGIGVWVIAGAVMARLRGIKDIQLTAVEADPHHFTLMKHHFKDNGFNPDKHTLFEAAIGTNAGIAYWPQLADSTEDWGMRPIFNLEPQNDQINDLTVSDWRGFKFDNIRKVTVVSICDLIRQKPEWDFVHMDIAGDETDVCRAAINEFNDRVKWILVGTHSRKHDGDILELFAGAGWILEHEKPARFEYRPNPPSLEAMTTHDGTQVWHNPRFTPEFIGWWDGFSTLEGTKENNWRWCSQQGTLVLNNTSHKTKKYIINATFITGYPEMSDLNIVSPIFTENLKINNSGYSYKKEITIPPGRHTVKFSCDANRVDAPKDPRYLVFNIKNFQIVESK